MANKIKCTCGHSWSTADSSAKDKYVCHICGKDNTMKDGGWLSKYEKAENGIEGTMGGLTDKGFNYNGAWGGPSMAMGGSMPGAVGFTYARTGGIPSNGPYAKKTKASAQNGMEMKFYQEGLDWKPRNISRDGSVIPKAQVGTMVTPLDFSKPLGTLEGVSEVMSAPARTATYILTGKYQDPSQALGIKNPVGAFITDAILDPTNLIGAGIATKAVKAAKAATKASKVIKPAVSSTVKSVVNKTKNLEDLQTAQKFAEQYGYELPTNLERIAQSDELTNRTIRGMMDRHNTFVRGVSTNWDEIEKRNPEILRHLEGKGFNVSTEEGSKAAAEYMATHVPISTGYGRADLNNDVFNNGLQGLYTSNSIPTAEGYTYGQGYVTKVKKPTDFSSVNRQDWITKNSPDYYNNVLPEVSGRFNPSDIKHYYNNERIETLFQQGRINKASYNKLLEYKNSEADIKKQLWKKYNYNPNEGHSLPEEFYDEFDKMRDAKIEELFKSEPFEKKLLRTERSDVPTDAFDFLIKKEGNASNLTKFLKTQPYQEKMKEVHNLGESLTKYSWNEQQPIRERIKQLQDEVNVMYNQSVQDYMKANHPNYDPINKYAHYIHIGTPGEKVLEPIKSWKITPDIWKNKSRAHSNSYTKKFSALEEGGVIKDDRGQWAHPGEITEIGSPYITMEGVPYPVLGISDTGDTQMMYPGEDYEFDGESVTEYPVMQNGGRTPIYVDNPKDKRLRAYQDSLNVYNKSEKNWSLAQKYGRLNSHGEIYYPNEMVNYIPSVVDINTNLKPTAYRSTVDENRRFNRDFPVFKKPVQPIIYRKPELPILYVDDPNDSRLKAYQDSLMLSSRPRKNPNLMISVSEFNKLHYPGAAKNYVKKGIMPIGFRDFLKEPYRASEAVFAKPKQKVEYRKPQPKKPEPVKKQEQPKPVEKKQNVYEGTPVYSTGAGSGLPSALIGFANQKGDTTYIKPEDYERFGVPKYGKEYVESKTTKKKNGGWLEKYK